jgi:phosphoribosylformylglycinamidine cyclo-ligase
MKKKKITYSQVGDNYDTKDPIKILAQSSAAATGKNLKKHGLEEVADSRGESAYVWKQGNVLMASVTEGLGTKNLIADGTRKHTGKTNYDAIGHDTVATIINDLVTVGAQPLVVHAYWSIEDNGWLSDEQRMPDLINGWKKACDLAGASWGGGETATMKGIVVPGTVDLAGCAIGIIKSKKRLITDKKLKSGDRILMLKSSGVNANGISLTRAIAKRLPKGYATKLPNGKTYGEVLLTKTNIYAKVVNDLLDGGVDIHYISNITGHGMRKIMRARQNFTYVLEKVIEPQEIFPFIQKHAGLSIYEMYDTYNMGMDYAIFIPAKDVARAQKIVAKNGFESLDAGYIEKGERQVIIKPLDIVFEGESLKVRA